MKYNRGPRRGDRDRKQDNRGHVGGDRDRKQDNRGHVEVIETGSKTTEDT